MKNSHIKDLKSEVPAETRLEVYKEVYEWINSKDPDQIGDFGLCNLLPVHLWGLSEIVMRETPTGRNRRCRVTWSWLETPYAFPELTKARIERIDEISVFDGYTKVKERCQVLIEMMTDVASKIKRESVRSETDFNVIRKDFLQKIGYYVNSDCTSISNSVENIQIDLYNLKMIEKLGEAEVVKEIDNCSGGKTSVEIYKRERIAVEALANILVEFEALCKELNVPSIKVYQSIIENN